MEPLGKMNAYFPVINEHISKRNKKVRVSAVRTRSLANVGVLPQLLDYDSARSKLRKVIEKPSEDPTKLPKVRCPSRRTSTLSSSELSLSNARHNKSTMTPKKSLNCSMNNS